MHRYFVRFLVAALTFGIGVVLSLVPALFTSKGTRVARSYRAKPPCRKRVKTIESPLVSIDNRAHEPLKLLYVSTTVDPTDSQKLRVGLLVENVSAQSVSGYSISCKRSWSTPQGAEDSVIHSWGSHKILMPGEAQPITFSCNADQALALRVEIAKFSDGSLWNNPRDAR